MNISGIRPYEGFYEYNTVKNNRTDDLLTEMSVAEAHQTKQEVSEETRAKERYNAYDYAQQFKPGVVYELKGADSDIASLDVEQAISRMKKDQVIQQYQFFVGEGDAQKKLEKAGVSVRALENFSI